MRITVNNNIHVYTTTMRKAVEDFIDCYSFEDFIEHPNDCISFIIEAATDFDSHQDEDFIRDICGKMSTCDKQRLREEFARYIKEEYETLIDRSLDAIEDKENGLAQSVLPFVKTQMCTSKSYY